MKQVILKFFILTFFLYYGFKVFAIPDREDYGKFYDEMIYAENLLSEVKTHQAISVYTALLTKDPLYIPARLELATIYMKQTKYVEAEKILLSIININKPSAYTYERLAYCYYLWSFDDKANRKHLLNKAFDAINYGMKLDKYNKNIYSTKGLLYIEYENYNEAQKMFNIARDLDPLFYEIYENWGVLYTRLGNYQKALKSFEHALELNSKSPRAYKKLGEMLELSGQYRQAVKYLKKSRFYTIYINYQDYYLMATLYERIGMLKEAINEYYSCLTIKPNYVDCYTNIAELYEALGLEEKAIEAYRKAIALDYSILETFIAQARRFMMDLDFIHARNLFIKILKIEPGNKFAYQGLASMYYLSSLMGDINIEEWYLDDRLMKSLLTESRENDILFNLMYLKFVISKDGLTNENIEKLIKIVRLTPHTAEDYALAGEALFLLQKYRASLETLNIAIDKYSNETLQDNKKQTYINEFFWFADRLVTSHELIASRRIYDIINTKFGSNQAVDGLAIIAKVVLKAENKYIEIWKMKKSKDDYNGMIIEELIKVIQLYPQFAQAHYKLSDFYSKISNYDKSLKELLIFIDLKNITPFEKMPSEKEIQNLLKKYNKLDTNSNSTKHLF